jgi:hypothetical protein
MSTCGSTSWSSWGGAPSRVVEEALKTKSGPKRRDHCPLAGRDLSRFHSVYGESVFFKDKDLMMFLQCHWLMMKHRAHVARLVTDLFEGPLEASFMAICLLSLAAAEDSEDYSAMSTSLGLRSDGDDVTVRMWERLISLWDRHFICLRYKLVLLALPRYANERLLSFYPDDRALDDFTPREFLAGHKEKRCDSLYVEGEYFCLCDDSPDIWYQWYVSEIETIPFQSLRPYGSLPPAHEAPRGPEEKQPQFEVVENVIKRINALRAAYHKTAAPAGGGLAGEELEAWARGLSEVQRRQELAAAIRAFEEALQPLSLHGAPLSLLRGGKLSLDQIEWRDKVRRWTTLAKQAAGREGNHLGLLAVQVGQLGGVVKQAFA